MSKAFGLLLLAGLGALAWREIPEIRRYLKIESM
jgi:hypothetical protein